MTARVNGRDYCLSAHIGGNLQGLSADDMELNRQGHSSDPQADVALQFAYKVTQDRGHITDTGVQAAGAAGYSDAQIIDLVTETAFSLATNSINSSFKADIDSAFLPLRTQRAA